LGYALAPVLLIGKSFETFGRVDAYKRIGGLLNVPVKGGVLSKPVQGNVPNPQKGFNSHCDLPALEGNSSRSVS